MWLAAAHLNAQSAAHLQVPNHAYLQWPAAAFSEQAHCYTGAR